MAFRGGFLISSEYLRNPMSFRGAALSAPRVPGRTPQAALPSRWSCSTGHHIGTASPTFSGAAK